MRTNGMTRRDDRGATLVVVAAFVVVTVVLLAVVVDLGGLRAERKEVTLSTDAAALAAAETLDFTPLSTANIGTDACSAFASTDGGTVEDVVNEYLGVNGESDFVDCQVTVESIRNRRAYVTVSAEDDVVYQVAPAFGEQDTGTTGGVSSASVGIIDGGIRPFATCAVSYSLRRVDTDPVYGFPVDKPAGAPDPYISLVDDAAGDPDGLLDGGGSGPPTVLFAIDRLDDSSDYSSSCGNSSGNFGQLDLAENGGSNGSGSCVNPAPDDKLCDNTVNGYQGEIKNPGSGSTGNDYNPVDRVFDRLEADHEVFWVPVYSNVTNPGNNARFTYTWWMRVEPIDHCFKTNSCGIRGTDGNKKRWFEWQVQRLVEATGEFQFAPPLTDDFEEFPARLCGVDGDVSYC